MKLLTILIVLFTLTCVSAIGNTIPVQIQVTNDSGNILTGTYEFTINISNSDTCNPVLYSNISTFTADNRGIVSYDVSVDLSFDEQYYLCYYRDGVLKETKIVGTNPYAFRANVSDYWDGLNTTNTTWFENLAGVLSIKLSQLTSWADNLYLSKDGDTMTGNLSITGNITANNFFGNLIGTWNGSSDYYTSTQTDTEITNANTSMKGYADETFITQANEGNLNVNSSTWWAGVSGWSSGWFQQTGNDLEFNGSMFNATLDATLVGERWFFVDENLVYGTAAGTLSLTQQSNNYDGVSYNLTEVTPQGLEYYTNTTANISSDVNQICIRYIATGDDYALSIYDDGGYWEDYVTMRGDTVYRWACSDIRDPTDHIVDDKILIKIVNTGGASTQDFLRIDALYVSSGYTPIVGNEVDPNSYHLDENINATGYNVTADYFIGNGSGLTGLNYVPYTGATSNLDLGDNNFSVGTTDFFVDEGTGKVGIGTTNPSLAKLQINGSVGGISIYAENNISAEDYLYHSPYPSDDYNNTQALNDLMKINGSNGKINHSTMPSNSITILNKSIYSITKINKTREIPVMENITYYEENCSYVLRNGKYKNECSEIPKVKEQQKQDCKIIKEDKFVLIENSTDYEKVKVDKEICIPVIINETYFEDNKTQIGTEKEPQTSVGMMLGNIIKSIQQLFVWNNEQDKRIEMLEDELCKKDNTYEWCV